MGPLLHDLHPVVPSQGVGSALLMKVKRTMSDDLLLRVMLGTLHINNTKSDVDERWMILPMTTQADVGIQKALKMI